MSIAVKKFNIVKNILLQSILDDDSILLILKHYWSMLDGKHKVLLDWIDIDKLDWSNLSKNKNAIDLLKCHIDKINWTELSENCNAISLIKSNLDKICWKRLSENCNAISLIQDNLDKISWSKLSRNPSAIHLLKCNLDRIDWSELSQNEMAISLLENRLKYEKLLSDVEYLHLPYNKKLNWFSLANNKAATKILKNNLDESEFSSLMFNQYIVYILENEIVYSYDDVMFYYLSVNLNDYYLNNQNWQLLSKNSNNITLLRDNIDKLCWTSLSENINIFVDEPMPIY